MDPAATQDAVAPWRWLSLRHLWVLIPFSAISWFAFGRLGDNSFLWHVRAGTVQINAGEVLRHDPFSLTAAGDPWRTQSWLADVGYGWLERSTGHLGWVPLMLFITGGLTLALVGVAVFTRVRATLPTGLALVVVLWLGSAFLVPRPVLFAYLFLAMLVIVIQQQHRLLWVAPPLLWLWAAVHGSFAIGLGLLVLEALRRRSRRLAAAALLSTVAVSATAHGLAVWEILWSFFANRGALSFISEWQRTDLLNPVLTPYLLVALGVLAALASGRIDRNVLWVVVPFFIFGLVAERNVYPAVIVLAPFAAAGIPSLRSFGESRGSPALNWIAVGVLVTFAMFAVSARPFSLDPKAFPSEAAVAALEPEPVFHGMGVGGYLIYAEWPRWQVFIDDRAELYGEQFFADFQDAIHAGEYDVLLDRHGIDQAMLKPDDPLTVALAGQGWVAVHADEEFVVLRR